MARDDDELRRLRGEHLKSSSQDRPLGSGENWEAIKRGVKKWLPDLMAMPADLIDAAAYAARKVARGQSERPVASLGAGEKVRGALERVAPRKQAEMTAIPDTDYWEEGARMANPLMFMNPKKAASPVGALAALSGSPGVNMSIVKPKGGNWFPGRRSELEGSLKQLIHFLGEDDKGLQKWADTKLRRYIQNQLATEEDPIRRLAEQGISHVPNPEGFEAPGWAARQGRLERELNRTPQLGKSPLARAWEDTTDGMIRHQLPEELIPVYQGTDHPINQWINKVSPDTKVWDLAGDAALDYMEFPHLMHELRNATRADSDLPARFRLSPEQLDQLGIEKAIRHVSDINNWRAAQKAQSRVEQLSGPAIRTIKEFQENNPKGLRWVEIREPELPPLAGDFDTPEPISRGKIHDESTRKHLKDALQYEGDVMGHCVGGYCDRVSSGDTRIFSLRDQRGEPHVTIETNPGYLNLLDEEAGFLDDMGRLPESDKELQNYLREYYPPDDLEGEDGISSIRITPREKLVKVWTLSQVKGKANTAPVDEYLPFVQQFLKDPGHPDFPGWGDLYDLKNTGLHDFQKLSSTEKDLLRGKLDRLFTNDELHKVLQENSLPWIPIDDDPDFAEGGVIMPPAHHDNLEDFLRYRGE